MDALQTIERERGHTDESSPSNNILLETAAYCILEFLFLVVDLVGPMVDCNGKGYHGVATLYIFGYGFNSACFRGYDSHWVQTWVVQAGLQTAMELWMLSPPRRRRVWYSQSASRQLLVTLACYVFGSRIWGWLVSVERMKSMDRVCSRDDISCRWVHFFMELSLCTVFLFSGVLLTNVAIWRYAVLKSRERVEG